MIHPSIHPSIHRHSTHPLLPCNTQYCGSTYSLHYSRDTHCSIYAPKSILLVYLYQKRKSILVCIYINIYIYIYIFQQRHAQHRVVQSQPTSLSPFLSPCVCPLPRSSSAACTRLSAIKENHGGRFTRVLTSSTTG
jgi:hypothetical protein